MTLSKTRFFCLNPSHMKLIFHSFSSLYKFRPFKSYDDENVDDDDDGVSDGLDEVKNREKVTCRVDTER